MAVLSRLILFLSAYLAYTASVYAQDLILTISGDEIVGQVMHVGADSVVYRHLSNTGGPTYTLPLQEVALLKRNYATTPTTVPEVSFERQALDLQERQELIIQAKLDAKAHYKGKGIFWTTMGSTVINPLAGLATSTVISAIKPNVGTDDNPNRHLQKDPIYLEAYKEQARRLKIVKAAAGFGAGIAVLGLLSAVAASVGGI